MLGKLGKPISASPGALTCLFTDGFSPREMAAWAQGTEGFILMSSELSSTDYLGLGGEGSPGTEPGFLTALRKQPPCHTPPSATFPGGPSDRGI